MYKIINNDPFFSDVKTESEKIKYNYLVSLISSLNYPNKPFEEIPLNTSLEEEHEFISNTIYDPINIEMINDLKNTQRFNENNFSSIATLESELIHLMILNNNANQSKQYSHVLSYFGEFLTSKILSIKYNNPNIFNNTFINLFNYVKDNKIFISEFKDEMINEWMIESKFDSYSYMIGLIYSLKFLNLYYRQQGLMLSKFNKALRGELTVDDILRHFHLSIDNKSVIEYFEKNCDKYTNVMKK